MTVLERMADAIQDETDCQCRKSALDAARAALGVIREPSPAIAKVAEDHRKASLSAWGFAPFGETLAAVIDAVLGGEV